MNNNNNNNDSLKKINMFTDKMLISTSKNNKEIYLWAENSGTIAFTYIDENLRTYIPYSLFKVIDNDLFSEFFIYLHEGKNLFNIWKTSSSKVYSKFSITDEKINCFNFTYDKKFLFVGTINGSLILYDIENGIFISNKKISNNEIKQIELFKNFIYILSSEKIAKYNIGLNFFEYIKNDYINEINFFNLNNNINNYNIENFIISELNKQLILYNNKNQIIFLNLKNLSLINIYNIQNNNNFLYNLILYENYLYFTDKIQNIYSFKLDNNIESNDTKYLNLNKENSILFSNNQKYSNISIFTLGTRNNIITGHVDGKIIIWRKKNDYYYIYEKVYHIHKGEVTNLILINKPISQYGLNFNIKVNEIQISDKHNLNELKDVLIKQNIKFNNYIDEYINIYNDDSINNEILKYKNNL